MAVTSVALHSQGTSGSATGSGGGTVKASYRSAYRVKCDSAADTIDEVLYHFRTTASLPWMGRRFKFGNGFNATVLCKTIDVTQVENSGGTFIAACSFESLDPQQGNGGGTEPNGQQNDDPRRWHDEIDVSFTYMTVPVETAKFVRYDPPGRGGKFLKNGYVGPIVNSLKKPIIPTIEDSVPIKVIRITKYIAAYNAGDINNYLNHINSDYVTINKPAYNFRDFFSPYRGLVAQVQSAFGLQGNIKYYRQTAEIHVHPYINGWRRLIADQGRDVDDGPGAPNGRGGEVRESDLPNPNTIHHRPATSRLGLPLAEPVNLDGNGSTMNPREQPIYLIYAVKGERSFAGIQW